MQHRRSNTSLRSWLIFAATALALAAIGWVVWSLATNHDVLPHIDSAHSDTSITVGLTDAPQSLDIRTDGGTAVERALIGNVYETLVTRDNDNTLQPGLAKSWKVSDDGLTYTFTMRSGLRFSNGHALDADDVVWSLQQTVKNQYQGAGDLAALKSVESRDSRTVAITLAKPDPTLPRALAGRAGIVYDSTAKVSYASEALGSGPFTVARFDKRGTITLERNDDYWGAEAGVARVTLLYYADDNALAEAVRGNAVDLALPGDAATANALAGDTALTITHGTSTSKVMLALNNGTDSIFSDQQARKAIRHAVDAGSIAASRPDSAGALGGPIGRLEPGYEDLTGLFPYDPGTASALINNFIAGASYFGVIDLVVPQQYEDIGNTVATQLQAVGLSVRTDVVDGATAEQRIADGQYTIAVTATSGDDDAAAFGTSDNVFRYTSGTAQEAYGNATGATNDKDYQERMRAFAKTVSQDAAADWLYQRNTTVVARDHASGYPTNMTDRYLPLAGIVKK